MTDVEYKLQREKVEEQKKNGHVNPQDLYTLAQLMARWRSNDELPVCLLCQDVQKKPSGLGHLIPKSVLNQAELPCFDFIRGRNLGISKMGFKAFCGDCEKKFQNGENDFNPKFFKPFYDKPEERIEVAAQSETGFPWLYFCLITIIWRCMAFIPDNDQFFNLLEILRNYILDPKTKKTTNVLRPFSPLTQGLAGGSPRQFPPLSTSQKMSKYIKLFIFAPNEEIENKLKEDLNVNRQFFYDMFHARFVKIHFQPTANITEQNAWLFLGPLHIYMTYILTPNDSNVKAFSMEEDEWDKSELHCLLTQNNKTFTIESRNERFFPVKMAYDGIVEYGKDLLCSTLRLKPPTTAANSTTYDHMSGKKLHLLPPYVSYNSANNEFQFPLETYELKFDHYRTEVFTTVGVIHTASNQRTLFMVFHKGIKDGDEVAMALHINDGKVTYAHGVLIPDQSRVNVDLSIVPFKDYIEERIPYFVECFNESDQS